MMLIDIPYYLLSLDYLHYEVGGSMTIATGVPTSNQTNLDVYRGRKLTNHKTMYLNGSLIAGIIKHWDIKVDEKAEKTTYISSWSLSFMSSDTIYS